MQNIRFSNQTRAVILFVTGVLALFALTACGSGDLEATTSEHPSTQPPAAPMVPATAPEPGSDEEQIMAVLERQVRAVNAADYATFQETCTPSSGKLPTLAQLKYIYEENQGNPGGAGGVEVRFSPQGYNVRNAKVKLLRAPFAQATFDVYDYDVYVSGRPSNKTFEKVDGQWYSESRPCEAG